MNSYDQIYILCHKKIDHFQFSNIINNHPSNPSKNNRTFKNRKLQPTHTTTQPKNPSPPTTPSPNHPRPRGGLWSFVICLLTVSSGSPQTSPRLPSFCSIIQPRRRRRRYYKKLNCLFSPPTAETSDYISAPFFTIFSTFFMGVVELFSVVGNCYSRRRSNAGSYLLVWIASNRFFRGHK